MIGGIGSMIGSSKGASASAEAAKMAALAQFYATNVSKRIYEEQRDMFRPYYEVGTGALPEYQKMLSGDYEMTESPAAKYQREQATKAMNRAMASRGMSGSGNAINRLTELNSSIAAQDWNNQYNRLIDAIKIGQGAAGSAGQAGSAYANNVGNAMNSLSNIYQNQGNTLSSIYTNMGNQFNQNMQKMDNNALNLFAFGTKSGWWG